MNTNESYIEVPVEDTSILNSDYSITFYILVEADGVFLHYRSTSSPDNLINSFKLEALSGDVGMTITNALGETSYDIFNTNLDHGTWYRLILQRDISNDKLTLFNWNIATYACFENWVAHTETSFPGTIMFGASFDGEFSFEGGLSCVQFVDTKNPNPIADYDNECKTTKWPPLPTTTTETPSSATTTTNTPTFTTTTVETPTTTQTTTPETPTSTPPTTKTPAITATPVKSRTATTTTTKVTQTITTTTTVFPPRPPMALVTGSNHYRVLSLNATYQRLGQILGSSTSPLNDCIWMCVRDGDCQTFMFKPDIRTRFNPVSAPGLCRLGKASPSVMFDVGSTVYKLV